MKVLHVVKRWYQGGVPRFIERLIEGTSGTEMEHSVLSICPTSRVGDPFCCYGPLMKKFNSSSFLMSGKRFEEFLRHHQFDVVHIHTNNAVGFILADAAKKAGVKVRIIHSHNSSFDSRFRLTKVLIHDFCRWRYGGAETHRVAVSQLAGKHLFNKAQFITIHNGVKVDQFRYDAAKGASMRMVYGVEENSLLVGNIGAFLPVKNHKRILEIFCEIKNQKPAAKLILVGEGQLREEIERQVKEMSLEDSVILTGYVGNPADIYSALDVLLFPSFYEGFPLTVVEAQCNGLPIIMSSNITNEVVVLDNVYQLSLDEPNSNWVSAIFQSKRIDPFLAREEMETSGLSEKETISQIMSIYVAN